MRSRRGSPALTLAVVAVLLAACGSSAAATPTPPSSAAPTSTPDPHLKEPVSVATILARLVAAKLDIVANTASVGKGGEPVKILNATFRGWPLEIIEYSSSAALHANGFSPDSPQINEPYYVLAGLNIRIEYGPEILSLKATPPPAQRREAAMDLVEVLAPLIGPIEQASIDPLVAAGIATPPPTPEPSPTATPKPSKTPKPAKTPKP